MEGERKVDILIDARLRCKPRVSCKRFLVAGSGPVLSTSGFSDYLVPGHKRVHRRIYKHFDVVVT